MKIGSVFSFALAATLWLAFASTASAHEEGVIKLSGRQLPAGGQLTVVGEKLGKGASYRLELRGALKTFELGSARADTSGRFEFTLTLPADAKPGSYAVAAVASDGDVVARADLVIVDANVPAASGAGATMPGMPGMPGNMPEMENMPGMAGMHATAEYMEIPRTTTTAQWIVIGAVIAGSLVGGLALLRRPPASREH